MINIIVFLEIKDQIKFHNYEKQAIQIMKKYQGVLLSAFKPDDNQSFIKNIDEIHYLQFPDIESFQKFREDSEIKKLQVLREQGIGQSSIIVSRENINY